MVETATGEAIEDTTGLQKNKVAERKACTYQGLKAKS
jgi:hypothetical protein